MKKFLEMIKVLWNDQRGRALIKLGIYMVFMTIVVLYARSLSSKNTETVKPKKSVFDSYAEMILKNEIITINDTKYEISFGNETILMDSDNKYIISNNVVKTEANEIIENKIYFWNITPKLIGNLIKDKEKYFETKYNDDTKEEGYKIKLSEFIRYFNGINLDDNSLENLDSKEILISIKQDQEKVISVNLDLTEYVKLILEDINLYNVKIEY